MSDDRVKGEENLVQEFLAPLTRDAPGALGLADDCAVLVPEAGHDFVLKTDPVVCGVHFFPDDDPSDIGWKALAVNVSDLAAKGATPVGYLMALSVPEAPTRRWMRSFADGLGEAQAAFGCHLLGGDTDRVPHGPLSIAITVFGSVAHGRMVRRGGARPGDRIFVSGTIGDSGLGLRLRQARAAAGGPEASFALLFSPDARSDLERRYLRPNPRLGLMRALSDHASAGMDLSDGLVKDAGRMARASGVDIELQAPDVPVSEPARHLIGQGDVAIEALLTAGDDYEVLAAVPEQARAAFVSSAAQAGIEVHEIGVCREGNGRLTVIGSGGQLLVFPKDGWDHLA